MSSSTTPAVAAFTPDHLSSSEQLCYVHCKICDTVLAVSVPSSSLFKTVTVRCGHCTNLLSVNMCSMFLPAPANNQLHMGHPLFTPHHDLLEEIRHVPATMNMNMNMNMMMLNHQQPTTNPSDHSRMPSVRGVNHLYHRHQDLPATPPVVNRPPEKRQRVPSAYNRFIKEEIQRIKAGNPDISHREAFSAAAKNWAHFPHIHFGLMPSDQPVKKTSSRQQEGEEAMKEGLFGPANIGVATPY